MGAVAVAVAVVVVVVEGEEGVVVEAHYTLL